MTLREILHANKDNLQKITVVEKGETQFETNGVVKQEHVKAVRDFETVQRDLYDFIRDNDEVMNAYFELAEKYNQAHNTAKSSLRTVHTDNGFVVGPFRRGNKPEKVVWDPAHLPDEILLDRSVIKTLDKDRLDALMNEGRITQEVVSKARYIVRGTPRINGPKEMVFDPAG